MCSSAKFNIIQKCPPRLRYRKEIADEMESKLDAAEFAHVKICEVFRLIAKFSLPISRLILGLHLQFLTSKCGLLKIFELLLGKLPELSI